MDTYSEIVYTRFSKPQRKRLEALSRARNVGISAIVREIVAGNLDRYERAQALIDSPASYTTEASDVAPTS